MRRIELSLILPCYNEAEHFKTSSEFILNTLKKTSYTFEIIFVEDKSKDGTTALIKEFIGSHQNEHIKAIFFNKNKGRGKAVTEGILSAKGLFVGFIDIDCEVSPEYISQFIQKLKQGYDVVCGKRIYRISVSGFVRAAVSRIYSFIMKLLLNTQLEDTEAGYKFFRKDKIIPVLSQVKDKGWFWDTEIMVRAERRGLEMTFLPVVFNRRTDKTSTVKLWSDSAAYFRKLLSFRNQLLKEYHE